MRKPSRSPTPDPIEVSIGHVGAEADGIARLADGSRLYLPYTLPNETVRARFIGRRGDGWHATAEAIPTASPDRVTPPCPHFGRCGGCAFQHWRDSAYRDWKTGLLSHALSSAGFVPPEPIPHHRGLPGERRRLDFAARRASRGIVLGLHAPKSPELINLTQCLILHPALLALVAPLRGILGTLQALRREASVVINLLDAGPDLLLRTDAEPTSQDRTALTGFAREHGLPRVSAAVGRAEPETICLLCPAVTSLSGITVKPPPGAFLQATSEGEMAIIDAVLAGLLPKLASRTRVAELYAGCGTLTFAIARQVRVTAYEGASAAISALRQAVNQAGLAGRIDPVQRDLMRQPLSARELAGFAAIVLDPPHAGAGGQMPLIAAAAVPTVILVSCNPASLSRDARALHVAGYRLHAATAIDQFFWSPRLESVCVFRRG